MADRFDTGETIYDLDTRADRVALERDAGHIPRDWGKVPLGSMKFSARFPSNLILSASEQLAKAKEMADQGALLSDVKRVQKIKSSHQGNTSQCWAHSVVNPMRLIRALNGQPPVDLTASSVGQRINGGDGGGWSGQAMEFICEKGVVPTSLWPENTFGRNRVTPEAEKAAMDYRVTEFWDLQTWDELMSALLTHGTGASGGWNHLGHAMGIIAVVIVDGVLAIRVWDSYGDDSRDEPGGTYLMRGRNAIPDDMCATRAVTAVG